MVTTCIIVNYNDSKTTSLLVNQIYDYEHLDYIVVVDNNSTDNSFEILNKLRSKKIHILKADYNGGYGYGNNLGIEYSYYTLKSDYVLIANPDVIFSNDCVKRLRSIIHSHQDIAISTAIPKKPNGENQSIIAWRIPTASQEILSFSFILNRLLGSGKFYDKSYFIDKDFVFVEVVQGSLLMIDANVMIKYGMYDEDFFLYGEEQVLATKMKEAKYKSVILLNQCFIHNHSQTISKSFNSFYKRKKLSLNSKLLYLKKYHQKSSSFIYFASVFLYFIIIVENIVVYLFMNTRRYSKKL